MRSEFVPHLCSLLVLALFATASAPAQQAWAAETWTIVTGPALERDPAIVAAVEDLQKDGKPLGLTFAHVTQPPGDLRRVIAVGDEARNTLTASLVRDQTVRLVELAAPQGFQVVTRAVNRAPIVVVAGGSVAGDVYGLYWLWDRMRVHKRILPLNVVRRPAFPVRLTGARTPTQLRNALRYTATWVTGAGILDLVPWDTEPERSRNEANREKLRRFARIVHDYHMKLLAPGDELVYHPELLAKFGAKLDPADPALWKALQEKYRRLLRAVPELDGVQIRTGELTRVRGDYRPFDIMHDPPSSDWTLERRYRTFLQKMHAVVVGEFDKIYFHRTWVTNAHEQHSDPDVYKRIFTPEVPQRNLYLSPYMSLADRWYYQPYNPTFNLTPHHMLALLSILDYHADANANVCPSFPGQYHQGGLRSILAVSQSNVVGVHFGAPSASAWDTLNLTAYTVFRLAWDPHEDLRQIAKDFAAIHLGPAVADEMAEILLLSHRAYKDGIYVKPVAEAIRGNTLPHLRLTRFRMRGTPEIDRGRAHVDWLETSMYEPSRERIDEAVEHLDRGLAAAMEMEKRYEGLAGRIENAKLAKRVGDGLTLTRWLVATNNRYVKTCFAYFRYREKRDATHRDELRQALTELKEARTRFVEAPGFCYHLYGIDQLIRNAEAALADLEKAEHALAGAPAAGEIDALVVRQQQAHTEALAKRSADAVRVFRWRGRVDGKEIFRVRGKAVEIEHLQDDPIDEEESVFAAALPAREVTVLVKDLTSRDTHPFLLEQPTRQNDYTAKIHLFDKLPGYGRWEFELYYVDAPPQDLGLAVPWQ